MQAFGRINRNIFIISLFLVFLATSCIPIDDLNGYWEKGTIDPELEGDWKLSGVEYPVNDKYMSFVLSDDHYVEIDRSLEDKSLDVRMKGKTLQLGKRKFLMFDTMETWKKAIKAPESKENSPIPGFLYRYTICENQLFIFSLNLDILAKAIKAGEVEGMLPKRDNSDDENLFPPTIKKLDSKSIALIEKWSKDNKNWTVEIYERVKDLESSMNKSRSYPASKNTPENTLVNINQPDLKYFAENKPNILLRQLKASPEWRVTIDEQDIVCYRREKGRDKWKVSLSFDDRTARAKVNKEDSASTRYTFRLKKKESEKTSNPYASLCFKKAAPLAGDIHLNLKKSDQGIESKLALGQDKLWFEFYEQRDKEARIYTRKALTWLKDYLKVVRDSEEEIEKKGYASRLIGKDEMRTGKPSFEIDDGFQKGLFDIYAWANPGEPGYLYLKAFDVKKGTRLSELRLMSRSKEYTGWSNNPKDLFYYNTHVTIYEGDWSHKYDARFELWFHPEDGSPERKLAEKTLKICGWQR